jgi:acyl carrier protein
MPPERTNFGRWGVARQARLTLDDLNAILAHCSILPPGMEIRDPNLTLADLYIDSVGMLSVALEIEERYGLALDEHNVPYLGPVGQTIEYINRLIDAEAERSEAHS